MLPKDQIFKLGFLFIAFEIVVAARKIARHLRWLVIDNTLGDIDITSGDIDITSGE